METSNNGNCLLIYGGGLCDPANLFMRFMADKLKNMQLFDKVYVGFYSFEAMLNEDFIVEWNDDVRSDAKSALGGYFGTCRDVNLATDKNLAKKAKEVLKKNNIKWVFVGGGDGSARQCAEIADNFYMDGINIAFVMPCTIDGIEGGISIGMRQAVSVSSKIIEQLASTCLNTRTRFTAPGLIVETQGRNRDDILANVIREIDSGRVKVGRETKVFAIPANYSWNREALIEEINSTSFVQTPVLILLSEGANIKKKELKSQLKRKVRDFEIAHLSQMNGMTNEDDAEELNNMLTLATSLISRGVEENRPFSLVYESHTASIKNIDYYATLNPRDGQHPLLASYLEELINKYTIR